MELIDRKDKELQELYLELDEVKSGLKKGLMLQDELFVRHHQKLLDFDDDTKSLKDMNRDLETTNQELIRKIELYEKSLNVFKSNDQSRVESRLVELTQRGAIEESNMIRLSRKFASLKEEHEELLEKWRNAQVGFTEKET
jgi:Ca2+-binding EF-hand superfamily protein